MNWKARLDHVAIATADPAKLKRVLEILGVKDQGSEFVKEQGVKTHFLKANEITTQVEILEPVDPNGVIAKYLSRKGVGIHHISFSIENINELMIALTKESIRLVYDIAKPGAHNTLVNFIHPESTGGVLIEISEEQK